MAALEKFAGNLQAFPADGSAVRNQTKVSRRGTAPQANSSRAQSLLAGQRHKSSWCPAISRVERAMQLVIEWAFEHRSELTEEWNLCQATQPPKKIAPLE
jgi:hypothetical protein